MPFAQQVLNSASLTVATEHNAENTAEQVSTNASTFVTEQSALAAAKQDSQTVDAADRVLQNIADALHFDVESFHCWPVNFFSLLGTLIFADSRARCLGIVKRFSNAVATAHDRTIAAKHTTSASSQSDHAGAVATEHRQSHLPKLLVPQLLPLTCTAQQQKQPFDCQTTLEMKPFLPNGADSIVTATDKRTRLFIGMANPYVVKTFAVLAVLVHLWQKATPEDRHSMIYLAQQAIGNACKAMNDLKGMGSYASKNPADMVGRWFLTTDAAEMWADLVWGAPKRAQDPRFWGTGSNSRPALGNPSDKELPDVLERISSKARLLAAVDFEMTVNGAVVLFTHQITGRFSGGSAIQFSTCKAAGAIKPLLSSDCYLAVKLENNI